MLILIAILWVLIWALTLVDLFRRDWSTGRKALWALGMLVLPVVGVLAYLIVRPPSSADVHGVLSSSDAASEQVHDRHPV
jgi:hypothetical protein